MTVVQRSRFALWLKNLAGFKGPFGLSLDQGIAPVYDFSTTQPDLDEEVLYWFTSFSVAAAALNFSQAQIKIPPQTGQVQLLKAVVDGFWLNGGVAATNQNAGITTEIAGAGSAVFLRNNYLQLRGLSFSAAGFTSGAVRLIMANNSPASLFTNLGQNLHISQAADPTVSNLPPSFPWVVSPGYAFTVESGVVNQAIGGAFWGRYVADQL